LQAVSTDVEGQASGPPGHHVDQTSEKDPVEAAAERAVAAVASAADSLLWLADSTEDAVVTFATQHSESRFRAVFDAASVGIALMSTEGMVFMANRGLCEMLDSTEDVLKGLELDSLMPEDHERESHRAALRELLERGGRNHAAEQRLKRADGKVLDVRATNSVIADASGVPHTVVVVIEDLTELKRLERDRLQKEQLQSEMDIARRIQSSMLPRTLSAEGLEVSARTLAAEEVGGDYYDVLPTEDGAWIAIGDVAGHGLPAGILMLTVQSAVAALTHDKPAAPPKDILCGLNHVIYENIHHRLEIHDYVTLSLIRFFRDGRMVVAGAHEDIIVYRHQEKRCETLPTNGTWIGVISDIRSFTEDATYHLRDGDVMVLFTDGVTEASDRSGNPFGFDRLCDAVAEVGEESTERIVDNVVARAKTWCPTPVDDLTVVALRFRA
jgi:PAS domain S-box-containing protein